MIFFEACLYHKYPFESSIIYLAGIGFYGVQKVKEMVYSFKIKWLQDSINSTSKVTEAIEKLVKETPKEEVKISEK